MSKERAAVLVQYLLIWKFEIDTKAIEGMMWMRWVKPLVCSRLA
jgi:hypothetical protein